MTLTCANLPELACRLQTLRDLISNLPPVRRGTIGEVPDLDPGIVTSLRKETRDLMELLADDLTEDNRSIRIDDTSLPAAGRDKVRDLHDWMLDPYGLASVLDGPRARDRGLALIEKVLKWATPPIPDSGISIVPGAFIYRGATIDLSGKPLQVLRAFVQSRTKRLTAAALIADVWKGDAGASEQNVKDAIVDVRDALKKAKRLTEGKAAKNDPIPCIDRAANLAWKLEM